MFSDDKGGFQANKTNQQISSEDLVFRRGRFFRPYQPKVAKHILVHPGFFITFLRRSLRQKLNELNTEGTLRSDKATYNRSAPTLTLRISAIRELVSQKGRLFLTKPLILLNTLSREREFKVDHV